MNRIHAKRHRWFFLPFISMVLLLLILAGCGSCKWNLDLVDYTPLSGGDWTVSTPEEQGLDPVLVAELYYNAAKVETLQALLVIKNGYLIAEAYFNGGAIDQMTRIQSVTKSYTSALVGIALDQGHLSSVDQTMTEFFPEFAGEITDPRKNQITIGHLLQMRAGYPWEESTAELFEILYGGFRTRYLVDIPLIRDPGSKMEYSNFSAHLLGVIVAGEAGTDLRTFAEANLFSPITAVLGDWITDLEGNYNGHGDLHFNARDMAKFGLLYLNDGLYDGTQVVPADWVEASLKRYSEDAWEYRVGRNFTDIGYGYQWWSVRAGDHRYNLAWGHGGQQIALLDEHNMVVVVKADPLFGQHGDRAWRYEKANLNLVGDFFASLPSE